LYAAGKGEKDLYEVRLISNTDPNATSSWSYWPFYPPLPCCLT
jgi:hypothetical protein